MKSSGICVGICVGGWVDGTEPLAGGDGSSNALVMLSVSEGGASGNDPGGSDNRETAGRSNEGEAMGEELWCALTMVRWAVAEGGLLADMNRPPGPRHSWVGGFDDKVEGMVPDEKRRCSLTSSM